MQGEYVEKREKAASDAVWYADKARHASTERERDWWLGFARISKSDVSHYAKLSRKYDK